MHMEAYDSFKKNRVSFLFLEAAHPKAKSNPLTAFLRRKAAVSKKRCL